jgi:hypothetical protein
VGHCCDFAWSLWNCLVGGVWKCLETWAKEAIECCMQNLLGSSNGSSVDQNVDRNGDKKRLCPWGSDGNHGNQYSTENRTTGHSCDIVVKNLSTFCPCPKTLWEADFKGDWLIDQWTKISRQLSSQPVAWALLSALDYVYSENCQ